MALHYVFDTPLDVSFLLRALAGDIEAHPTQSWPGLKEFYVAVGALREAADKIEKAVYDASEVA